MKLNHPSQWETPQERAEYERIEKMSLTDIRAYLISEGVDVDAFTARIKHKIKSIKETGIWPTD